MPANLSQERAMPAKSIIEQPNSNPNRIPEWIIMYTLNQPGT